MTPLDPVSAHSRNAYVLLIALDENPGRMVGELPDLPGIAATLREPLVEHLGTLGLVHPARTNDGLDAVLTKTGQHEVARAREARAKRMSRVRFVMDPFLRWLYDETEERSGHPAPEDFAATAPEMYGQPIARDEVLRAAELLREAGFIEGQGAYSRPAPIRPELTAKGRYTVEQNRSVHDPAPVHGNQTTTNVYGPSNVAVNSTNVTQYLTVSDEHASQLTNLLDLIAEQRSGADADALVNEARAELQGERRSHVLRATVEKLRAEVPKVLSSVVAAVVTNGLTALTDSM